MKQIYFFCFLFFQQFFLTMIWLGVAAANQKVWGLIAGNKLREFGITV